MQQTPPNPQDFQQFWQDFKSILPSLPVPELQPFDLVVNLLVAGALSAVLAWHYARFGRSVAGRVSGSRTLVFICLITVLIISIVKSSIPLSLGLVGALSIIRFRTPIKDPEELAYIFMAIAIGVALGADQRLAAAIAFALILGVITAKRVIEMRQPASSFYVTIETPETESSTYRELVDLVAHHVTVADLRRLDARDGTVQATFFVVCSGDAAIEAVISALREKMPGATVNFVDQEQILAV